MNPHFHSTVSLLLDHKIRTDEEIQRRCPEHNLRFRDIDRHGVVIRTRRGAGRGLIALGTWLNPAAGAPASSAPALQA